ncbi:D-alanyl-D-alanine carboxypeptidase, partial [Corallococcus praedator]
MGYRLRHPAWLAFIVVVSLVWGMAGRAAPFAAFVMDARTGVVIHSQNAETRLHPASLT